MTAPTTSPEQKVNVRIGHSIGMATIVAVGSAVTVGLGAYLFLGPIYDSAGTQAPSTYFFGLFFLLPLILATAERASITPGRGGFFNLSRSAESVPLAFTTGWLLFGGLIVLAALFAWEGGFAFSQLLSLFFSIQLQSNWLGALLVLLVLVRSLSRAATIWRRRTSIVYAAIILLCFTFCAIWATPVEVPSTWVYLPSYTLFDTIPYLAAMVWGLQFVLNRRDELQRPRRRMLPALVIPLLLGALLGALAAATLLLYPYFPYQEPLHLVSLASQNQPLLGILLLLAMTLFGIIGLNEAFTNLISLSKSMETDGFLPSQIQLRHRIWQRPFYTHLFFIIAAIALLLLVNIDFLVGQAGLVIMLASILVHSQDITRTRPRLAADRWPKLPFHPLFPGLAVAIGVTFVLTKGLSYMLPLVPWIIAGMLLYAFYARDGAIAVRRRDTFAAGAILPAKKRNYRVLVAISDPAKAASLIRLGSHIAAAKNGLLVVLQVVPTTDDEAFNQQRATDTWQRLSEIIPPQKESGIQLTPLVRLSAEPAHGILTTIWEEKIDFALLGWPVEHAEDLRERDGTLGQIVRKAQCEIAILKGTWEGLVKRVLVPVVSAGHSSAALSLGQDLCYPDEISQIVALRVLSGTPSDESEAQAKQQLRKTVSNLENPSGIEGVVIRSNNKVKTILQEAKGYELLLLGLSEEGLLADTDFDGVPVEVAAEAAPPTLLVKRHEHAFQYWLRRSWDKLHGILPTLTSRRQAVVGTEMRSDARADVDFYVLMVIAASIALFGLLQNSAAVIIGAMLVAPLMSPILAMAHTIVRGQLKMLREAASSAANGIVLAISIAALLSLSLLILGIPLTPTAEILARTQPNFLYLLIALASGAAAAYAISRSEVSAALPGVAIAAALVPPLAVVGYGLGTAQFDFAAGALLLFLTNLTAIVLAAAVIFLLLGFRPPARDDRDQQARYGLRMAVIAIILIAIPLFATTRVSAKQAAQEKTAVLILQQYWPASQAQVVDIVVKSEPREDLLVSCTIYDYAGVADDQALAELQSDLSSALNDPVKLNARVIAAKLTTHNNTSAARVLTTTPTPTITTTPTATPTSSPTVAPSPTSTASPSATAVPIDSSTTMPSPTATGQREATPTNMPLSTATAEP